jgi:hypothetical protein
MTLNIGRRQFARVKLNEVRAVDRAQSGIWTRRDPRTTSERLLPGRRTSMVSVNLKDTLSSRAIDRPECDSRSAIALGLSSSTIGRQRRMQSLTATRTWRACGVSRCGWRGTAAEPGDKGRTLSSETKVSATIPQWKLRFDRVLLGTLRWFWSNCSEGRTDGISLVTFRAIDELKLW